MTRTNNEKVFKIFNPGHEFPAISLSGTKCELDCAHCGGKYLQQMIPVDSPDDLMVKAKKLVADGATGALISGGCDSTGHVIMEDYFETFKNIKEHTPLILNVHTGMIDKERAIKLAKSTVDIASVDVVGDQGTIQTVYGLNHSPEEYQTLLQALDEGGIKSIVPHVCIGLDFGRVKGEFNALDVIACIEPAAIVFIILIPTKDSRMADCLPPSTEEVLKVITYARSKFASTPIYLGCMRPRSIKYREYTQELERLAIDTGIDGIVLPSKQTLQYLKNKDFRLKTYRNCCAVG